MNKHSVLIVTFFALPLFVSRAFAQNKKDSAASHGVINYDPVVSFPGGNDSLKKFIHSHLREVKNASGKKVIVAFIIKPDGTLKDFRIARGLNAAADTEALRVVRLFPKWEYKPIIEKARPDVAYVMPITF